MIFYRLLFKLILQRVPAETAHSIAARGMHAIGTLPGLRRLLRRALGASDPCLEIDALGLTFPSPLGVAAGMDKDLTWFEELGAIGFGFVEVGTVTAHPQSGNERPRIHRLIADRALINSMGFPNHGAVAAAARLRRRDGDTIVAVNIGKSKVATDVGDDYRQTVRALAPLAEFIVLNVSSPNTPGLREIQETGPLTELIADVRAELDDLNLRVPLLVKISPDLDDDQIDAIAQLALRLSLDGIVAVNTTTGRQATQSAEHAGEPGGLSGPPLRARALAVLRRLAEHTHGDVVLISVGGIETAADAWERLAAGASLVQAHTGFVYGGPFWPNRLNRDLAALVRAAGAHSIREVIGSDVARNMASDGRNGHATSGIRALAVASRAQ